MDVNLDENPELHEWAKGAMTALITASLSGDAHLAAETCSRVTEEILADDDLLVERVAHLTWVVANLGGALAHSLADELGGDPVEMWQGIARSFARGPGGDDAAKEI
ncbi:MAG: hypothetical protein M3O70_21605 [Actinomycetota bacterium]|nr:hypothetical protein [Actinomycetota bacterium]